MQFIGISSSHKRAACNLVLQGCVFVRNNPLRYPHVRNKPLRYPHVDDLSTLPARCAS